MGLRRRKWLYFGEVALDFASVFSRKWITCCVELVQDRRRSKEIGSPLQRLVLHLFRRPIVSVLNLLRRTWRDDVAIRDHAEVHHLHRSVTKHLQVRWIEALMDQSLFEGIIQCGEHLFRDAQDFVKAQLPAYHQLAQSWAFNEVRRQIDF